MPRPSELGHELCRIAAFCVRLYLIPMPNLTQLANPAQFLAFSGPAAAVALRASRRFSSRIGLYLAFFVAPADYQQGDSVRIMYVHVPAAILAMACYTLMAISALGTLVWRHPLADVSAKAAAPLGAALTLLGLVTGSIWGRPMWGAWWVWDARLTSFLVLLIMYLGLMALWRAFEDPARAGRVAAVLILVGFVNIPIIKFSVEWWNTLHQPASILRLGGPSIHPSMLWPLIVMLAAFAAALPGAAHGRHAGRDPAGAACAGRSSPPRDRRC